MSSSDPKPARSPDDVVKERLGVSLADAIAEPPATGGAPAPDRPDAGGPPRPTHADVAQQTHMQQQDRPDGTPDRDEKLVKIGRGQQTSGRM
jgi:hypothetical protein